MEKTLLFSVALVAASCTAFAQSCTPDNQYAGSAPGIYPETPLEPTCDLIAAKTIISLTDTVVEAPSPLGGTITVTVYIDALRINEVQGLPAGLTFETDVMGSATQDAPYGIWLNSGSVPNQTSAIGCAFGFGTGGDWDALVGGGPNNDGIYPLTFIVDARVAQTSPDVSAFGLPNGSWLSENASLTGGAFSIVQSLVVPADYAEISTSISGDQNVEPGTTYTYSVPQDPNVTYDWTVLNGSIESGQGTNEIEVIWSGSGVVEVNLTDGGCEGADGIPVTAITTGLDEVAGINASVYPNPSKGEFNLRVADTDVLQARVVDVSGKVILSNQFAGSNLYTIDLNNVKSGVYILELESETGKTYKRLIKN
jgi:hypothetical protein